MMLPTPLRQRLLALGTAAFVATGLASATAAQAGSYEVFACKSPTGAPAPVADGRAGWIALNDDGASLRATNNCADGGGLNAVINRQGTVAYGAWVAWKFVAPEGTSLRAFDLYWTAYTAGTPSFGGHAYVQRGDGQILPGQQHTRNEVFGPLTLRQQGLENIDHVHVGASCVRDPCVGTGATHEHVAWSRLTAARMILEDTSQPRARVDGGTAAGDTTWQGTETFRLSAEDAGSGVYRAALSVDGVVTQRSVLYGNEGRCADAHPTYGSDYQFVSPTPCARNASGTFAVDTKTLADGRHDVLVTVEDAAGNEVVAHDMEDVLVDNVPKPSVTQSGTITGAAAAGRTLQLTPAVFDAHGAATPTVTRVWQRCHSVEARCVDVTDRTGTAYELDAMDAGKRLRVLETATNGEGETVAASAYSRIVTRADGSLPVDGNGIDDDGDGQIDEAGETKPVTSADNGKDDDCDGQVDESGEQLVVGPCNNGRDDDGDGQVDEPGETLPTSGGAGGTTGTSGVAGATGPAGTNGRDGRDGGSSSTSTTIASSSTTMLNGTGASRSATLTASFRRGRGAARTLSYGSGASVVGRLVDEAGRPIGGAEVAVAETVAARGATPVAKPGVTTGADGRFTYAVRKRGASRRIQFAYAYERGGAPVTQAALDVRVRAATSLKVSLRGVLVTYRGTIQSRPLPTAGKLVIVQGRVKGGPWQTFASPRANRAGTFTGRYRLKVRNPGRKLQFRARVVSESGYAYLTGTSRTVTRTVR